MGATRGRSVAILGGGMGALTAAFELTEGNWTERYDRVTVYQRGWRLGGKGASSRGAHGRIEEHGLHVLLGYYDHTFDVMRRCYEELDRPNSDPGCPIRSLDDAVSPSQLAGVVDHHDGRWSPWVASFGATPGRPGDAVAGPGGAHAVGRGGPRDPITPTAPGLLRFAVDPTRASGGSVRLSTSAVPPRHPPSGVSEAMSAVLQGAGLIGLTLPLSWAQRLGDLARTAPFGLPARAGAPRRHRADPGRATAVRPLPGRLAPDLPADRAGHGEPGRHRGRWPPHPARGVRRHRPSRLPRLAGRARHRSRGPCIADPPGNVRPGVRVRGRRSRPAQVQRRARTAARHEDADGLPRSPVLEDAGGDGRGDLRPPVTRCCGTGVSNSASSTASTLSA